MSKNNILPGKDGLCDSCAHCTTIRGDSKVVRQCHYFPGKDGVILWPVRECQQYRPKNSQSLREMEATALYVEKPKDKPGFTWKRKQEFQTNYPSYDQADF